MVDNLELYNQTLPLFLLNIFLIVVVAICLDLVITLSKSLKKYTKTKVEYPKECVPIPHSALHEIYGCILKRAYLYDEDLQMVLPEMDWKENVWIERDSLENAKALHEWLRFINGMTDGFQIKDEDVPDEEDRKDLLKSPKNYEYEFRIDQV